MHTSVNLKDSKLKLMHWTFCFHLMKQILSIFFKVITSVISRAQSSRKSHLLEASHKSGMNSRAVVLIAVIALSGGSLAREIIGKNCTFDIFQGKCKLPSSFKSFTLEDLEQIGKFRSSNCGFLSDLITMVICCPETSTFQSNTCRGKLGDVSTNILSQCPLLQEIRGPACTKCSVTPLKKDMLLESRLPVIAATPHSRVSTQEFIQISSGSKALSGLETKRSNYLTSIIKITSGVK